MLSKCCECSPIELCVVEWHSDLVECQSHEERLSPCLQAHVFTELTVDELDLVVAGLEHELPTNLPLEGLERLVQIEVGLHGLVVFLALLNCIEDFLLYSHIAPIAEELYYLVVLPSFYCMIRPCVHHLLYLLYLRENLESLDPLL